MDISHPITSPVFSIKFLALKFSPTSSLLGSVKDLCVNFRDADASFRSGDETRRKRYVAEFGYEPSHPWGESFVGLPQRPVWLNYFFLQRQLKLSVGSRSYKGDRLLFLSLRGRPRGRRRASKPERRRDFNLPIFSPEWSLPIQTFTDRSELISLYRLRQLFLVTHRQGSTS